MQSARLGNMFALLAAVALAVPVVDVPARLQWGRDGHASTGKIAQLFLHDAVVDRLQELLPDDAGLLGNVCSWADDVRSKMPWSFDLHFINTPDWDCDFIHSRDCADEICVSGAISNYTTRLTDQTGEQQVEALKFLVHFIGDIHQPLHVGFASDEGGNTIEVNFLGTKKTNLHSVWDTSLPDTLMARNFSGSVDKMSDHIASMIRDRYWVDIDDWLTCKSGSYPCPDEWATESIGLACNYSYVAADGVTHLVSGDELDEDYYARAADVVVKQLAKAGYRMAAALNNLLG